MLALAIIIVDTKYFNSGGSGRRYMMFAKSVDPTYGYKTLVVLKGVPIMYYYYAVLKEMAGRQRENSTVTWRRNKKGRNAML